MIRSICAILLLFLTSAAWSEEHPEITRFCTWKANAARVITMNRDLGLDEMEVTGNYLNQNNTYEEQLIILQLIEQIFGPYEFVKNDTIYSQTKKTCSRDFYMSPGKELASTSK